MEDRDDKGKFIQGNKASKGRPKGSLSINDELRKLLAKKDKQTGKKYIEVIAYKIFQEALKDNDRVLIEMWQQIDGKPRQQVDVDANVKQTGEIVIINASGKQIQDDEKPLNEDNTSES